MEINNVGSQPPVLTTDLQDQAIQAQGADADPSVEQLAQSAETAFASVFFSLLQNILGEAQNNSSS